MIGSRRGGLSKHGCIGKKQRGDDDSMLTERAHRRGGWWWTTRKVSECAGGIQPATPCCVIGADQHGTFFPFSVNGGTASGRPITCHPPKHFALVEMLRVNLRHVRHKSTSPYGRTHVSHRKPPTLPSPVVPLFPQLVVRADGSSYTHHTTSPRSTIRLTRDVTNSPLWNAAAWAGDDRLGAEEEGELTGRLARFKRKFDAADVDWSALALEGSWAEEGVVHKEKTKKK
jgi:hypothetical protein